MSITARTSITGKVSAITHVILDQLALLSPMAMVFFAIRADVAWQFFKAGLTKITGVEWLFIFPKFELGMNTVLLFEEEYSVPLLDPGIAAHLAAYVELMIPVFIFIGLLTRPAAFILFGFNLVAVVSYFNGLWPTGLIDHAVWALFLLALLAHGGGKWSVDHMIRGRVR